MCIGQHRSAQYTLVVAVVILSSNNNSGSSSIGVGIITRNSNSGQLLHSLPCSVTWDKSLG